MSDRGTAYGSEFGFELRVCAWAERRWPARAGRPVVVARQLGTRERRWDTVILECDPEGLERRARFGADELDSDLLHVVRHAPGDWAWYRDALPDPGYPWRYVREAVHRAAERGVVETRRDGNRIELRRKWAYPDWVRRVVAVENKPDLDASAAAALAEQAERDVALGLADEVWVATEATGERVEPIVLEDLPDAAGVLAFDFDAVDPATVLWHPRGLDPDRPGTRVVERPAGGPRDLSAARFEYVDPGEKAATRRELAERAYGRGWRSYVDTMRSDCASFHLRRARAGYAPWCAAKEREQTAAECSGSCPAFAPEQPAWRTRGWPLEGGPGASMRRALSRRRERRRPDADV
ncbi:MAG: DUF5787 family protein [Halobacteriaceae archaeon]